VLGFTAAFAAGLLVGSGLSWPLSSEEPTFGPSVDALLQTDLRRFVLTELDPDTQPPPVSLEEAERAVRDDGPFDRVHDALLAHIESSWACDGCNAWILSMDLGARSDRQSVVAIVDADSGRNLGMIGSCYPGGPC
jgi:hypothetical protein